MRTLFNSMTAAAVRAAVVDDASDAVAAAEIATLAENADAPETEEASQERKARLLAAQAQAEKASQDGTAVPAEVLEVAKREIMICWEVYSGDGGVYDLQKQAKRKLKNIAQHILTIAKECAAAAWKRCEDNPDAEFGKLASAMFRNSMAMAELALRGTIDLGKPEMEAKLDSFIAGSWTIYRSQVRTALEADFDPRDHESIYSLTQAVKQAKEARSTGTRDDDKDKAPGAQTQTNADAAANGGTPEEVSEAAKVLADASVKAREEGDKEKDSDAVGLDWSELEVISQKNGKVQSALILLHRAIHSVDLGADNNEERVINSLNLCARQINALSRRETMEDMASLELDEEIGATAAESAEEASPMAKAVAEQLAGHAEVLEADVVEA